jgi:hypothetical protein
MALLLCNLSLKENWVLKILLSKVLSYKFRLRKEQFKNFNPKILFSELFGNMVLKKEMVYIYTVNFEILSSSGQFHSKANVVQENIFRANFIKPFKGIKHNYK